MRGEDLRGKDNGETVNRMYLSEEKVCFVLFFSDTLHLKGSFPSVLPTLCSLPPHLLSPVDLFLFWGGGAPRVIKQYDISYNRLGTTLHIRAG